MSRTALLAGSAGATGVWAVWGILGWLACHLSSDGGKARGARRTWSLVARIANGPQAPSSSDRRRLATLAALAAGVAGWLIAGPLLGLTCALAGPAAAAAFVRARRRRFAAAVERCAPEVARAMADALTGGRSIHGAVEAAATDVSPPLAAELAAVTASLGLGTPLDAALGVLRIRCGSRGIDLLVAAILLQREAGGDLAGLLREIADGLEQAQRAAHDARAATAQARFTGLVVGTLPIGAAMLAEFASPGQLKALADSPLTLWLAGSALVLQVIGLVAIRRLARVAD